MFAVEVAQLLPRSLIWSPSNTRGELDHQVFTPGGRVLSFECKGVISNAARDPTKPWKAPIDYPQLTAYIAAGLPILYVFPSKPRTPDRPWRRPCATDPDFDGWCQACGNIGRAQRRRWAGKSPLIANAAIHLRFQPWFAHWCWVVPGIDLDAHLATASRPASMSCRDRDFAGVGGADRLCHFLDDLSIGEVGLGGISMDAAELADMFSDLPLPDQLRDDSEATPPQFLIVPIT
jgi:hypothetical protein